MNKKYNFFSYVWKYKAQYVMLCMAYVAVVVSQILIPDFLSDMTSGLGSMEKAEFLKMSLLFFGFIALEMLGSFVFGHYNYKLSNVSLVNADADAVELLTHTRYEELVKQNLSYLVQIVHNDFCIIMDFFVEKLPSLVLQFVEIAVLIVLLLKTNVIIGLAALLCLAFYVGLYFLSQKKYYVLEKEASAERSAYLAFAIGKMSNVLLIKLNAWQAVVKKELRKKGDRYLEAAVKQLDFQNLINNFSTTWGRIFLLALVVILYFVGADKNVDMLKVVTISLLYIQQLISCAKYVIQCGTMYQSYRVSRNRVQQILSMPKEEKGEKKLDMVENITLDKVSFSYGERKLLNGFSKEFTKNHSYAIVGENGSGKTTLLLLILGILHRQGGEVCWNGEKIETLNTDDLRKNNIGFVNQEPMLMEDTIYNNLFYGQEEKAKPVQELEQYPLLDFVKEKKDGFETMINSQSNNLSGGQKQRIAIVRALLRDSEVLIFDEPTSALDTEGTKQFLEMLQKEKKNRIIFIVTHDEAVVEQCDEMIDFRKIHKVME